MKKIFIDLDGGKKLNLGALDSFSSRKFRLRSVDKNQFQARINIGLNDDINSYKLGSFYLDKLKPSSNGYSYMECFLKKERRRFTLIIKNGGRAVCREEFSSVPRKIFWRNAALSLAGLLLIVFLTVFLLTFDFSRRDSIGSSFAADKNVSSREKIEPEEPVRRAQPETAPREPSASSLPMTGSDSEIVIDRDSQGETETKVVSAPEESSPAERSLDEPMQEDPVPEKEASPTSPDFTLVENRDLVLHFTPNSSKLEPEALRSLENVLSFLLDYPEVHVKITGHCAIAGTEAGRREISVERAVNVEKWLRRGGWEPLFPPQVKGEAGDYPLTRDPENQEINRRVEIDLSE